MSNPTIELDGLEVQLGGRTILHGLTGILKSRAIGLLGPNGAGKSTLINTLLGFHSPSKGSARVLGIDSLTSGKALRSLVGYMPENDAFISKMSGVRFVRYMAEISGLPCRTSHGARARSFRLRRTRRSALSAGGNVFSRHETIGQAGPSDCAWPQSPHPGRTDQRHGSAGAQTLDRAHSRNSGSQRYLPASLLASLARRGRDLRRSAHPSQRKNRLDLQSRRRAARQSQVPRA